MENIAPASAVTSQWKLQALKEEHAFCWTAFYLCHTKPAKKVQKVNAHLYQSPKWESLLKVL